jgi:hypothetical protein
MCTGQNRTDPLGSCPFSSHNRRTTVTAPIEKGAPVARFRDQQLVRLRRDHTPSDGSLLAAGSVGIVIKVYPDGKAYEVKFADLRDIQTIAVDGIEDPD